MLFVLKHLIKFYLDVLNLGVKKVTLSDYVYIAILIIVFLGALLSDWYFITKYKERIEQLEADNIAHKNNYGSIISVLINAGIKGDSDV